MNADLTFDDIKDGAVYTVQEAADVLGICYNSVLNAIHQGELQASRPGGYRILGRDIKAFWERTKVEPKRSKEGVPSPSRPEAGKPFRKLNSDRLLAAWQQQDAVPDRSRERSARPSG
jgi:excisionase family DNA binding protein